ncbi:MAG TPA: hemerythrin domain-containing protein [Pyrinomonadaceae bacterium]|jgi:iron-sulfur cluster repair protein YtfE (RIC family)|nr:hemerythrin domain-containing protein [Pyrinomonadaceae bacterium]
MNAIDLLKTDHRKVEELFQQVEDTPKGKHGNIFKRIKAELDVHTHIEEKIFYPRLKKEAELKDITLEGIEEHHQAKMFLKEIPRLSDKNERFEPKLKVLMEDIKHHVKEEERVMFPKAQVILSIQEMEQLGAEMEAEKKRFKKTLKSK